MKYYAILNENNICYGHQASSKIVNGNVIPLTKEEFQNEMYLYHKYENGAWSIEKFVPDYAQIELNRLQDLEETVAQLLLMGGN